MFFFLFPRGGCTAAMHLEVAPLLHKVTPASCWFPAFPPHHSPQYYTTQYACRRPTIRRSVPLPPNPLRTIRRCFSRSFVSRGNTQDLHEINRAVRASDTEDDSASSNPPRAKRAKSSSSSASRPPR